MENSDGLNAKNSGSLSSRGDLAGISAVSPQPMMSMAKASQPRSISSCSTAWRSPPSKKSAFPLSETRRHMPFFCDGLSGLTHTAGMTSPSSRREIRQPFAMPPSIFHFANVTRIAMSASSKSLLTISPSSGMRSAWYSENNSASGSCGSASSQTWAFTFSNAGFVVSSVAWNVLSTGSAANG